MGLAILTLVCTLAGLLAAGLVAVVEWGGWTLAVPGRRLEPAGASAEPAPWEPVEVAAADGVRLVGAWRADPEAAGRLLVLLHGFAEDRVAIRHRAEAVGPGWNVLVPDARGYGRSGGDCVSFGVRESADLRAWLDRVEALTGAPPRAAVWGRSMGSAVAVKAAAEDPRVAALVLESPYTSLETALRSWLARSRLPGLLAGPILRRAGRIARLPGPLGRPTSLELAPRIAVPTLVVHGGDDRLILAAEARRLAEAFPTPAGYVEVPGARHTDVFEVGGPDLGRTVAAFLERAVPREP